MGKFTALLKSFGKQHPIKGTGNVKASVMTWHSNFRNLLVSCFYSGDGNCPVGVGFVSTQKKIVSKDGELGERRKL